MFKVQEVKEDKKSLFVTLVDQKPACRSAWKNLALISATNVQRKIDEMKEGITAVIVLKNMYTRIGLGPVRMSRS
jgi:hypothetical protein